MYIVVANVAAGHLGIYLHCVHVRVALMMFKGEVGWDSDGHVHVTLLMLC